jgi:hypothetical protein
VLIIHSSPQADYRLSFRLQLAVRDKIIQRQQQILDEHGLGENNLYVQQSAMEQSTLHDDAFQVNKLSSASTAFSPLQRLKPKLEARLAENSIQKKDSSGYRNQAAQKSMDDDSDQASDAAPDIVVHGNKAAINPGKRAIYNRLGAAAEWIEESSVTDLANDDNITVSSSVLPRSPRGGMQQNDLRRQRPKNLRKKIRSTAIEAPVNTPSGSTVPVQQEFNIQGNGLVMQVAARPSISGVNRVGRFYRAIVAEGVDLSNAAPSLSINEDDTYMRKQPSHPLQPANPISPIRLSAIKPEHTPSTGKHNSEAFVHQPLKAHDDNVFSPTKKLSSIPAVAAAHDDYEDEMFEESTDDLQSVSHEESVITHSIEHGPKVAKIWSLPSKKLPMEVESAGESKQSTGNGSGPSQISQSSFKHGKKSSAMRPDALPSQESSTSAGIPSNTPETAGMYVANSKYLHGYRSKPAASIRLTKRENGNGQAVGLASNAPSAQNAAVLPLSGIGNVNSRMRNVSII